MTSDMPRQYNNGTSGKVQNLSFMTLLWPILPNLPPEPPKAATNLPDKNVKLEQCDVCGCPTTLGPTPTPATTPGVPAKKPGADSKDASSKAAQGFKSPLAEMMAEIEKKMDVTLSSIEKTTKETEKLTKKAKELETVDESNLTDEELMETLKSLMNEKTGHEKRVKGLEAKEQELKDSLKTAIEWGKNVDADPDE